MSNKFHPDAEQLDFESTTDDVPDEVFAELDDAYHDLIRRHDNLRQYDGDQASGERAGLIQGIRKIERILNALESDQ